MLSPSTYELLRLALVSAMRDISGTTTDKKTMRSKALGDIAHFMKNGADQAISEALRK